MRKVIALLFALCAVALPASLPVSDFNQPPDMTDDLAASLYLTVEAWKVPVGAANRFAAEAKATPEEFQVAAFLANQSGLPLAEIWDSRLKSRSWARVAELAGVTMDQLMFTPAKDYGAPYSKAYSFWRNHPRGWSDRSFSVDDVEFIRLVEVQTLMRASGKNADEIVASLSAGDTFTRLAASIYRQRHAPSQAPKASKPKKQAH